MADETTPQVETTLSATETTEGKDIDPVPYKRFKEINDSYSNLKTEFEKIKESIRLADEAKLKEQNDFKTLYEKLQGELHTEKQNSLRLKVASQKGIPADLVDRLRGETEEDIAKDAEGLLAFIKQPEPQKGSVTSTPRGGASTAFNFETATPQQIRDYLAANLKQ